MQRSSYAQRTWIDCDNGGAQNFDSLDSLLAVGYKMKDALFDEYNSLEMFLKFYILLPISRSTMKLK